jgi:hypothetical protein
LIHKYFADLKAEYNREDWYSVEEIMENLPEVPVKNSWCFFAPLGEELAELLED